MDRRKRIALVIGSGSVKCAASIGLYKVLQREGIGVNMVVGCSAGAIYAALIAIGHSPELSTQMTQRLWTKEITDQRDNGALLRAMAPKWLGFTAERFGLRSDRLILERLRESFGDTRIEDLPLPLHITATDFDNGELVDLASGSLVDAIRASIALPFAFRPWRVGGRLLIDGFVSDPLPVSVAIKQGADIILAMGFESPYQQHVSSAGRFAFQLSSMMSNNLLRSRFAFHAMAHHSEVIAVMPEFRQRVRLFDTEKIPYIIEEGERAAEEQLPYLRQLLAEPAAVPVA